MNIIINIILLKRMRLHFETHVYRMEWKSIVDALIELSILGDDLTESGPTIAYNGAGRRGGRG